MFDVADGCDCKGSWEIGRDIPENVISKLQKEWPDAKLEVSNNYLRRTDIRMYSSPLLHSLKFNILNHTATVVATDQLEQYSIFPDLRKILIKSPNLRKLSIIFGYNWMPSRVNWSGDIAAPRVLNLPLIPSDWLPPLHELSFSGPPETYEFDLEHCRIWSKCMDWSQLRRLDLGISCPQHFFEQIGSQLRSLRSLTAGIRTGNRRYTHWKCGPLTCENLGTFTSFIESLPGLQELRVTDFEASPEKISSVIVYGVEDLRSLSYHASICRSSRRSGKPHAWKVLALEYLRRRHPNLSHLEVDFPLVEGKWVSRGSKL